MLSVLAAYLVFAIGVANKIQNRLLDIPNTPLTEKELEVLKRVVYSHYLLTFDSTSDTANEFLAYALDGFDLLELSDIIDSIDADSVNDVIKNSFKKEKICVAVAAQNKEVFNNA